MDEDDDYTPDARLATCPFCGATATIIHGVPNANWRDGWQVKCACCHANTCWWHTEDESIAAWNQRPDAGKGE